MFELPYSVSSAFALALVATLGYLVGRAKVGQSPLLPARSRRQLHQARSVADQLDAISDAVHQSLAMHQASIAKFKERLGEFTRAEGGPARENLRHELEAVLHPTQRLTAQLAQAYEDLRQQASDLLAVADLRTDPITGLGNRRALDESVRSMFAMYHRYETPFALLLVAVDGLVEPSAGKRFLERDTALRRVASLLESTMRETDTLFRHDENGFAVVMPQTSSEQAVLLAARLCEAIEQKAEVLATAGIAWTLDGDSPSSLIARAEEARTAAQTAGGRVVYQHDGRVAEATLQPVLQS